MVKKTGTFLLFLAALLSGYYLLARQKLLHPAETAVLHVMMNLSAFGVESDDYPSIAATLDFERHTGHCVRTYYNPAYPSTSYDLTANELSQVQQLLQRADLQKFAEAEAQLYHHSN